MSEEKRCFINQVCLVIGTALRVTADSTVIGYPAILLPQLRENGFYTDKYTGSFIASGQAVGMMIACLFMTLAINRFGRKKYHIICGLPMAVGWIMIYFARNTYTIIFARFIQGLSIGFRSPISTMVIAESTDPKYRGGFLGTISLSLSAGVFYSHIFGTLLSWQMTAVVCFALLLISTGILFYFPDSPTYLAKIGRYDEAKQSFRFYRGNSDEANKEIEEIIAQQIEVACKNNDRRNSKVRTARYKLILRTFEKPEFYKPMLIMLIILIVYGFAGTYVLSSYTIDILIKITGSNLNPYFIMNSVDVFKIIVSLLSCLFIKQYPRRIVYFTSLFITLFSLTALSGYIYLSKIYSFHFDYIVLICLLFYTVGIGCGIQSLPYVIMGEILPVEYKGLGASLSITLMAWVFFLSVAPGPFLFSTVGEAGTFLLYAGVTAICWVILYYILPETKDKTLLEIEERFKRKVKKDNGKEYELQVPIDKTVVED